MIYSWVYSVCQQICRLVGTVGFGLKVYNKHLLPERGGCLVVANHQSVLDPPFIACQFRRQFSFLAKSELFDNKYFGGLIRRLNAFPVRQGKGDVGAVRETIKRLQEGHVLILFPEGSRSFDGELQPLQTGVGLVIRRAGVPVVPAVIDGTFEALPRGRKFPRPTPVRVLYGPALDLDGLKADEIVKLIDRTFREMFAELRRRMKDERDGRTRNAERGTRS